MAPGQAVRHHPSRRIASVATIVVLALIAPLGLVSPASGAPNRPAQTQTQTQGAPDRPATDPFGVADARPKPPGAPASGNRPFGAARASESTGTASITVVLDAQPDDGQDVAFTGCGPLGCGPFILDDDADPLRALLAHRGAVQASDGIRDPYRRGPAAAQEAAARIERALRAVMGADPGRTPG